MRATRSRRSVWHSRSALGPLFGLAGVACLIASCGAAGPPGGPQALSSTTCAAVRTAVATMNPSSATPAAHGHPTYTLTSLGPVPHQQIWHPGASIRFSWCTLPGPTTDDSQPAAVWLGASIQGPFPSRAAAVAAQRAAAEPTHGERVPFPQSSTPPDLSVPLMGPVVARAQPLRTDTWSSADQKLTIVLPTSLASGFYIFQASMDVFAPPGSSMPVASSGSNSGILQVTPD